MARRLQLRISDHAVLRYLERVGGLEVEKLRRDIEARIARTIVPGASAVIVDGYRWVVRNSETETIVVTVIEHATGYHTDPEEQRR